MALLDEIAEAEDVEELSLVVPAWKTSSHPDGVTILFRGLTFKTLVELQGTFDLKKVEEEDLNSMIELIALTAYDPDTRERLFETEAAKEVLRGKSYSTLLFLMQEGATVVVGTDAAETAGKDSSSTPVENRVSEGSSSESLGTQAEQSGN